MEDLAIRLKGLGKRYGDVVAGVVGSSGAAGVELRVLGTQRAGKTTAMRILLGLARPTAGTAGGSP